MEPFPLIETVLSSHPGVLWYLFAALLCYFTVFSGILLYHLVRYGTGAVTGPITIAVYFAGSGIFLSLALFSVLSATTPL